MYRKPHRRLRAFCSVFMLTMCLLLLGCGFLVAEYNTRRTAFGETRLQLPYEFRDGKIVARTAEDEEATALPDWAQELAGYGWRLIPARSRAAALITEAQQEAAARAFSRSRDGA